MSETGDWVSRWQGGDQVEDLGCHSSDTIVSYRALRKNKFGFMSLFITRVELHGATERDYTNLHVAMSREGFSHVIVADNSSRYILPTAEYNMVSYGTSSDVLAAAQRAANSTGISSSILVTESTRTVWSNLPQAR